MNFRNYFEIFKLADEKVIHNDISKIPMKRIILSGNGSVINGWRPIEDVLRRKKYFDSDHRTDLSQFVNQGRTLEALILITHFKRIYRSKIIYKKLNGEHYEGLLDDIKKIYDLNEDFALEFKKNIEKGSIHFRPEIKIIYDLLGNREELLDTMFFTLNWDSIAWNDPNLGNVGYLHGNIENPESMFMPSQYLSENDEFITFSEKNDGLFLESEKQILLRGNNDKAINNLTQLFINCLDICEELYIWGFGLQIYDANIFTYLSLAPYNSLKKIVIIITSDEKAKMLKLFALLFPKVTCEVHYIDAKS
ncbi:hypothetical protein [Leptospira yasudae]|uniref:hypothetical protein n=1 Tax=Leptospira yasudae TaxID=2202201 RepID=UPI001090FFC7|nr:hypothetical protein [Leptospira yasudae]TGM98035.1 hypothetical protein EHR10_11205 [Leptospira yasudae]